MRKQGTTVSPTHGNNCHVLQSLEYFKFKIFGLGMFNLYNRNLLKYFSPG